MHCENLLGNTPLSGNLCKTHHFLSVRNKGKDNETTPLCAGFQATFIFCWSSHFIKRFSNFLNLSNTCTRHTDSGVAELRGTARLPPSETEGM